MHHYLVDPGLIVLLLLHGEAVWQGGEHFALKVESGQKGSEKFPPVGISQQDDLLRASSACVANGCFGYLNSENVKVGVDLWVATINYDFEFSLHS